MSEATAQVVRDIVDEVLQRNDLGPGTAVGLADDLYDLGFDSLLIIQVAARVRQRLGADPPLAAYFDAGTVAELVTAVETAPSAVEATS